MYSGVMLGTIQAMPKPRSHIETIQCDESSLDAKGRVAFDRTRTEQLKNRQRRGVHGAKRNFPSTTRRERSSESVTKHICLPIIRKYILYHERFRGCFSRLSLQFQADVVYPNVIGSSFVTNGEFCSSPEMVPGDTKIPRRENVAGDEWFNSTVNHLRVRLVDECRVANQTDGRRQVATSVRSLGRLISTESDMSSSPSTATTVTRMLNGRVLQTVVQAFVFAGGRYRKLFPTNEPG